MSELPPPGWYSNRAGQLQWWGGSEWTDHLADPHSESSAQGAGRVRLGAAGGEVRQSGSLARFLKRRSVVWTTVPAGTVLVLMVGYFVFASPVTAQEATVVRVVDGDTVDVRVIGTERRVRVLNIDTPETVDPNQKPECLGTEATAYTRSLLDEGDVVSLEYDKEREDRYGRILAHIVLKDGRVVSTELAAAGLGVPLVVGGNDARIGDIDAAFETAAEDRRGFFDPKQECTFAAQVSRVEQSQEQAQAEPAGSSATEAATAATSVAAIWTAYSELRGDIEKLSSLSIKAFVRVGKGSSIKDVQRMLADINNRSTKLENMAADREKAEDAVVKKAAKKRVDTTAAVKAAQQAAVKKAAKKRADATAAAKAAQQDAAAEPEAPKPRSSEPANPYSGYTGPRCYAPGGKAWKPC